MFHPHADMHPPGAARWRHELHLPPPASMTGGEQLLARIYEAVRSSASPVGSNATNTLLLVTFDEHGGTFDHVPPPPAPPPVEGMAGEQGFRFDRSGVRVPMIAISAWVDPRTVVTDEFRSTSVIRTLRERWSLGAPLTGRDAVARDVAPVLARSSPRPPESWPNVGAKPVGLWTKIGEVIERPLSRLERDLLGEALAHESIALGRRTDADSGKTSRREAREHMTRIRDNLFPGFAKGRTS